MSVRLAIATSFILMLSMASMPAASNTWQSSLDKQLAELVAENSIVGLAVGIVRDRETIFAAGYGHASMDAITPITEQTAFHWASISKPFVSVAIMQLAERGELNINDRIAFHLPYFRMADERYRDITIAHLLSHTSGMPDVADYQWNDPQTDDGALKRWILELADRKLLFVPGTDRKYSNIGFEILGLVVQETAETTFEDYMQREIFDALDMRNSSFVASDIEPALRVDGHHGKLMRRPVDAYPYNRRHAPSSTLNTNISDMSKFAIALLNDGTYNGVQILQPGSVRSMWSVAWTSPADAGRTAALGWNVGRPWGGILSASHGGHDDGFRSFLYLAPEENTGIFIVANDDTMSTRDFMRLILEQVFPQQAAEQSGHPD